MDFRIRLFLDTIIAKINEFDDIPLESKRLVLESVLHIVEKKVDELIAEERDELLKDATLDIGAIALNKED